MNDPGQPQRESVRQRIKRLKTLPVLPTLLTAGNLASGLTAILCAAHASGEARSTWLYAGAIMIFVAMVCDMLDGKVARLTNTEGAFGAELDSLSDVVSFGAALISVDGQAAKPVRVGNPVDGGLVLQSVSARRAVLASSPDAPAEITLELPLPGN